MSKDIESSFQALPRRIFLDTSIIQNLLSYGGFIFEREPIPPSNTVFQNQKLLSDIENLERIFTINGRAHFEFALSKKSISEAMEKGDGQNTRWVSDLWDYWRTIVWKYGDGFKTNLTMSNKVNDKCFNYFSDKDRILIQDAVYLRCDSFLTMDYKLLSNANHIERELGIRLLSPTQYWELLEPFARLWY